MYISVRAAEGLSGRVNMGHIPDGAAVPESRSAAPSLDGTTKPRAAETVPALEGSEERCTDHADGTRKRHRKRI